MAKPKHMTAELPSTILLPSDHEAARALIEEVLEMERQREASEEFLARKKIVVDPPYEI